MTDRLLADRSVELVRGWVGSGAPGRRRVHPAARRLAALLADPHGLAFTMAFVDRVIRPEDPHTAALNLRRLAGDLPRFLPWHQRLMLRLGAMLSRLFPAFVIARASGTLRRLVGHLVVDARPPRLGRAITRLRKRGDRLNLNLLGEAVLGEAEAARRREATVALIERPDVDHVSVKISAIASQLSPWAFDDTVERVARHLRPIYAAAAANGTFVNLDMESFTDLDLTVAAFTDALEDFPQLEAGIVLQAYLPDALPAMQRLQGWAAQRVADGGARIKVRVVKGANLPMERVDAELHGWPLVTWATKAETDAHYKRVLDYALRPEHTAHVRIGVAGQNLFDLAWAWLLAGDRGVRDDVVVEMLLGMDTGPAEAVRAEAGGLLLYTPVVHPDEFDTAIAYLVRRLEENASDENFMSSAFRLASDPAAFDREAGRFLRSIDLMGDEVPATHRTQNRLGETAPPTTSEFANTPDTDPSIDANRTWARQALARADYSQLGTATLQENHVFGPAGLATVIVEARRAAEAWQQRDPDMRAWLLHQAGHALAARRGDLITVMAAEAGKTVEQADTEISEAIDFAHHYAEAGRRLHAVDGARFRPARLTVVTPPWNFPVAIPAGSVLAALASGSGVVIKPAPQTPRCAAVMVEALWQAGVPRDLLRIVDLDEAELGRVLVSHEDVDRVVLTGAWDTAALFRSWRPDLPLLAETSGKNAIVVTPSADLDLAVADLVRSAFGHAGQKCSAASLGILVGPVGESERFRRQLVDAVTSLRVGPPTDPATAMGPLIEPPGSKLHAGLTELGEGESWLVEPRQLDEDGQLWSPGVRLGVRPGSAFHTTEYFGPVLGLMHATSLDQAIDWQNGTDYGLTAGLHSLDPEEIATWADSVEAGNLYVNRGITGAIVQRQPFGGWKRSSVGATAKAGGPNYLTRFGSWEPAPLRIAAGSVTLSERVESLLAVASGHVSDDHLAWLRAAAASDQVAWEREFGRVKDVSGLVAERNALRYVAVPVTIRSEGPIHELVRLLLAAARVGASVTVSSASPLPSGLTTTARVESHEAWLASAVQHRPGRVRLHASSHLDLATALGGDPDVAIHADPVTGSGHIEALPFVVEQAISITQHRFGTPIPATPLGASPPDRLGSR